MHYDEAACKMFFVTHGGYPSDGDTLFQQLSKGLYLTGSDMICDSLGVFDVTQHFCSHRFI